MWKRGNGTKNRTGKERLIEIKLIVARIGTTRTRFQPFCSGLSNVLRPTRYTGSHTHTTWNRGPSARGGAWLRTSYVVAIPIVCRGGKSARETTKLQNVNEVPEWPLPAFFFFFFSVCSVFACVVACFDLNDSRMMTYFVTLPVPDDRSRTPLMDVGSNRKLTRVGRWWGLRQQQQKILLLSK